jgi:hypothetical protein
VRLLVLYEGLKIENLGILNKIPALGSTNDGEYACRYFLRRAIATLHECGQCMASLESNPEFQKLKLSNFGHESATVWDNAARLLSEKKAKWMIGSIRDDVGGHFGHAPAKRVVSSLRRGTIGRIAIRYPD